MAWSDALVNVLLLPFTAGNSRTVRNRPVHLDGTTSTVVISIVFTSLLLLLVKAMIDQENTLLSFAGTIGFLSVVVSFGLLSCVAVIIVIKVKGFHSILDPRQDVASSRLQKIVLWGFGMVSVTFCFLKSGHLVECIDILDNAPIMECVFYVIILVFLPVQILLLTYLTPYRFKRSVRIQYTILLMLASNITMWVYSLMTHDQEHSHANPRNVTWNTNCTNKTFTHMLYVSEKILSPIFLEYSMLAITMTHNLSVKWETYNERSENTILETHSLTETSKSTVDEGESDDRSVPINAETPLLSGLSKVSPGPVQRTDRKTFLFYVVLMLYGLLSVSIFIGYIVRVTVPSEMQQKWIASLELVISIMMAICTFYGYHLVARDTNPPFKSDPISGGEYVFIISAVGTMISCTFSVMTSLKSLKTPNYVFAVSRGIFGTLSYLQTVLILHASRCSPKHHCRNKASLKRTLLLLSLYNLGAWIIESFILGSFPSLRSAEKQLLGQALLEINYKVCHPMNVFFRFASALELYELYKKYGG
ncbi:uncharacterized protein LOC110458593 [Mizuhopecten yessoensis]|uniref:uncharacterized protein LOC110458593 n=1 Tax=Mizuhopecten yessoensis TaxID=6573 RepID=UPI000B45E105|nr:uncharacterized protein LOC110458593 [Mizuhopecten yessoensis]